MLLKQESSQLMRRMISLVYRETPKLKNLKIWNCSKEKNWATFFTNIPRKFSKNGQRRKALKLTCTKTYS
jgi:hypothetical protein